MHWRRPAAAGGPATKPRDGRPATVACDERLTGGTLELRALEGRHLVFTGPERPALPTTFEGDLRGTGVVLQLPRNPAEPLWELELGFEAAR